LISILKQVIKTKNDWGLKPLIIGSFYELFFLIRHPRFKYLFAIEPQDLDISIEDSKLSDPYVPAPYYILTISLNQIKNVINNFHDSIFIDIGCGPGRALYYSSTIGFNRLIGIEQSKQLTDMCNQNLKQYLPSHVNVKIVNQNVKDINFFNLITEFARDKKTDSLVLFLYKPFHDEILKILLHKLDELNFIDCFIIYFGPQKESTITQKNFSVVYSRDVNPDTPIKIYSRKKSRKKQT
jgi:SAM-dependent methyltransferase